MIEPVFRTYDRRELHADGVIHIAGIVLALSGGVAIIALALHLAHSRTVFGAGVYALCLLATLCLSALYNLWPERPVKRLLRRLDHAGIFLLIAGTYTPFALRMGAVGERFLVGLWCLAALGMGVKIMLAGRFNRLAIAFYLALGWSGIALFGLMAQNLRPASVILILVGGFIYSVGLVFHLRHSLRFQNAIWHLFVLIAAACHYAAVWLTVVALGTMTVS